MEPKKEIKMFVENNFNEEQFEDDVIDTEVIDTEDVELTTPSQKVSFSNGVVFTPEELDAMDPALKAKLLKVKADEAQMQKGFNAKLQALKAAKPATTPAPKAEPQIANNTDPVVRQFVYGQIVDKKYETAKAAAEAKYGHDVVSLLLGKQESINMINSAKESCNVNFDFDGLFTTLFANNISSDEAMLNAFNEFKGAKSEAEIKKEAEAKAKLELLKAKQVQTSGLPNGGERVIEPPAENTPPSRMAEAHRRAAEMIAELRNK